MTAEQQKQIDEIDADRRRKEAILLLLLLALLSEAEDAARAAIVAGAPVEAAIRTALAGVPGVRLGLGLGEILKHGADSGYRAGVAMADTLVPRPASLPIEKKTPSAGSLESIKAQTPDAYKGQVDVDSLTDSIVKRITDLLPPEPTPEDVGEAFDEAGLSETDSHMLAPVATTEIGAGHNTGLFFGWADNPNVLGLRFDNPNDAKTSKICRARIGVTLEKRDPWWKRNCPLLHPNCFLPGTMVEGSFVGGLKAFYSGQVIEIESARGCRLSVTANHPVFTDRGWVRATNLRETDALLTDRLYVERSLVVDDENPPARIEDVFDSFPLHARRFSGVSSLDLYGDGKFLEGEIDVVPANRRLLMNRESFVAKIIDDLHFIWHYSGEAFANCLRLLDSLFDRASSSLHGRPCSLELFRCSARRFNSLPFYPLSSGSGSSRSNSGLHQSDDCGYRTSQGIPDCLRAFTSLVSRYCGVAIETVSDGIRASDLNASAYDHAADRFVLEPEISNHVRNTVTALVAGNNFSGLGADSFVHGAASVWDVSTGDKFLDSGRPNPKFSSELEQASAGQVSQDKIVKINRVAYTGHVYDLQSMTGWILSNGIVTSNCRSAILPVTTMFTPTLNPPTSPPPRARLRHRAAGAFELSRLRVPNDDLESGP